jgi:hypothetical protein
MSSQFVPLLLPRGLSPVRHSSGYFDGRRLPLYAGPDPLSACARAPLGPAKVRVG